MLEKTFKITNLTGLDARMSSLLVTKSSNYSSMIRLQLATAIVDLKSIMGVMSLNAKNGELIKITCDGEDELDAMDELSDLIVEVKLGKEY